MNTIRLTGRFPYGYKEPGDIIIDARQLSVWPLLESVGVSTAGTIATIFSSSVHPRSYTEIGQDWIARALRLDPRTRMTASEALQHAWITGGELVQTNLTTEVTVNDDHDLDSYDSDSSFTSESEDEVDEDDGLACYACGAKRRRAGSETGSETLEGSEQEAKLKEDVWR